MITIRSFRSKILLALVAVALVPTGLTVAAGTVVLREVVTTSGTAGPWESVAESGRVLLEAVEDAGMEDPGLESAARQHREALTESVRLSRLYAAVSDRFLQLLPLFAVGTVLLVAALSVLTARFLSRIFSRPIQELVGWTERIAREEPLPAAEEVPPADVREFEHLREALRSMADELEEGRRRAVESARLRSWTEMARSVAHELKNPLGPMRMAAGTVAMMDEPRAADAGQVLMEEIDRLDDMARSFSRLGRMPEGPMSEVDLEELLDEVVAPYRQDPGDPVSIEVDVDPSLPLMRAWYDSLVRIFQNLVGNAHEAASATPGGDRWVRVSARRAGPEESVEIVVRDSGEGIPPEQMASIWEPDFTTKARGTGLGLTLVRQAVEAHGGTVRVRNAEADDAGAEFRVTLPLRGSARDSGQGSAQESARGSEP
ncbi:MAG: HAMP domain-containing sensor histidine kinase [Longimicrobiales bacterium]|nr:HAMP domain-containing sensor histidine kinase [Longimicrobiales bacterium]